MAKYNWTIDTLINRMKLIERLIEKETDEEQLFLLQTDYRNLQNHIDDYFDNTKEDMFKLLEGLQYLKDELTPMEFLWPDFQEFAQLTPKFIKSPTLKRCNLSKNDLLSITHDFYKQLNSFFFGNFMKNFYRRNDHIVFRIHEENSLYVGETITLPSLKESFIEILREYTTEDVLTTIHEYSHATSTSINPYHLSSSKTLYTEIDTIFMELIASDYLDKLMKSFNAPIIKADKINEFSGNAETLCAQIDLIEAERQQKNGFRNNKHLKQIALEEYDIEPDEVEDILNFPQIHSSIYLTSFMFALELYKMYKEDQEKALYYLKKIILLDDLSEEQYYHSIKRFGIIPNLSTSEFYKECKSDVLRLTRKKSKPRK